jgi:hypothetical protein
MITWNTYKEAGFSEAYEIEKQVEVVRGSDRYRIDVFRDVGQSDLQGSPRYTTETYRLIRVGPNDVWALVAPELPYVDAGSEESALGEALRNLAARVPGG